MSDWIIKAENLGKKYRLQHQAQGQRYTALRDVIAEKAKALFRRKAPSNVSISASQNLSVSGASSTEDFWALKDVSFEIKQGEVVGNHRAQRSWEKHAPEDPQPHHRANRGPGDAARARGQFAAGRQRRYHELTGRMKSTTI